MAPSAIIVRSHAERKVSTMAESPVFEEAVTDDEELVEEDLLVEDVSIDGMCGVY